jgi:hypothetical protein
VLHRDESTSAGLWNEDIITGLAKRFVHDGVGCDLNHTQLAGRPNSLRSLGCPSRLQKPGFTKCCRLGVSVWNSRRFGAIILSFLFLFL